MSQNPVCGDHWHGLSGNPVNGSDGCPWCLLEERDVELAKAESAGHRQADQLDAAHATLAGIASRGCQCKTILHLFNGQCECPPCIAAAALGKEFSIGTRAARAAGEEEADRA